MDIKKEQLYFDDPRLHMTIGGRLFARSAGIIAIVIFSVTAAVMLLIGQEQQNFRFFGVLMLLFLIDYAMHRKEPRRVIDRKTLKKIEDGGAINVAEYMRPKAFRALIGAMDAARIRREDFYLLLLRRLCSMGEIKEGLMRMDIDPDEFEKKVVAHCSESEHAHAPNKTRFLSEVEEFVSFAFMDAAHNGDRYVEAHDLFSALMHVDLGDLKKIFGFFEIEEEDLENALLFGEHKQRFGSLQKILRVVSSGDGVRRVKRSKRVMNRAWTARPTKTLDLYGTDLTAVARAGGAGFLVGHKTELERLTDVLSRPQKGSALLVGEPGSGRRAVVLHLAYLMVEDHVPSALFDKRLVELSVGSLAAGAEASVVQERMRTIVEEIIAAGNVILYIPDMHNLLRTAGGKELSAGDILLPYALQGAFQTVGATDPRDYKRYIEQNSEFSNTFEVIRVKEIDPADAVRYLVFEAILLERQYGIIASYKAVRKSVDLARKYVREKLLPSSAVDILKEAFADGQQKGKKAIREEDVIDIVERKTEVPIHTAGTEEAQRLLSLEDEIHKNYIDQEEAVGAVARALREYRSGLSRQGGPIATFLFVGPTGVGKTELSKNLARIQFGSEKMMLRFDMSEFQEKQSLSRFLGSSDGEIAGQLTEAIRLRPHSLVLLDEFEKAHPDILNLFLQVFDDGRLTDGIGNIVDFSNTIIIATSNAHSDFIQAEINKGRSTDEISEDLKKMLVSYFKPELLNRFSDIVVFRSLSMEHIEIIARLNITQLAGVLDETHGITLHADDNAIHTIAQMGYDPQFGARPLRKVVSEHLKSVLANAILRGDIGKGDTVLLRHDGVQFVFEKESK